MLQKINTRSGIRCTKFKGVVVKLKLLISSVVMKQHDHVYHRTWTMPYVALQVAVGASLFQPHRVYFTQAESTLCKELLHHHLVATSQSETQENKKMSHSSNSKTTDKKEEAKPVAWGYDGCDVDPCHWHEHFPAAKGSRQSPVAIDTSAVKKDTSMEPLNIKYDSHMCSGMINNGHTFCIGVTSDVCNLTGGPLSDKYRLLQFHVHWGADDSKGAEHTVDGVRYAAELHLVHWNTDKFESAAEAIKSDGGIAVLTVFLKVGKEHSEWNKLLGHFKEIEEVDHESRLEEDFNPVSLLPENVKDFWTYEGSLTTPPCYESVRFIIFREPTELSKEQLAQFRLLCVRPGSVKGKCDAPCKLVDNFRPLQPLNGRVIHSSS